MQRFESVCDTVLENIFLLILFISTNKFTASFRRKIFVLMLSMLGMGTVHSSDVYISEYAEGTPYYNRYLEIYNGSDSTINIVDYVLGMCQDACTTDGNWETVQLFGNTSNFPVASRQIEPGNTYVIRDSNGNVNATIKNAAQGKTGLFKFSGNDPVALIKKGTGFSAAQVLAGDTSAYTVLDVIGKPLGTAQQWQVCGQSNKLANVTLIKKEGRQGNTDWDDSRGTGSTAAEKADNCDWVVQDVHWARG